MGFGYSVGIVIILMLVEIWGIDQLFLEGLIWVDDSRFLPSCDVIVRPNFVFDFNWLIIIIKQLRFLQRFMLVFWLLKVVLIQTLPARIIIVIRVTVSIILVDPCLCLVCIVVIFLS